MKQYCAGFVFDDFFSRVILIKKEKPVWQKGLYNAVGGKIESFDKSPADAMARECQEEINLVIPADKWVNFAELKGIEPRRVPIENNPKTNEDWSVEWFYANFSNLGEFKSNTDEKADIFNIKLLPKTINNINWLICMAISLENDRADKFVVTEIL